MPQAADEVSAALAYVPASPAAGRKRRYLPPAPRPSLGEPATVPDMTIDVRARRAAAAARWRPDPVHLLLIAEAPPSAPDRYFYFEHVIAQDSFFRYVAQGMLGTVPPRAAKGEALAGLRARGVFLIDVSPDPVGSQPDLSPLVPDLTARVTALDPGHVVLIRTNVYDVAYEPLRSWAVR